ncbi:N-lysine methyltransferase SMYD2 [Hondaea fermentalgiana]|uniref:N-lysine methyltransferase SMYD2 n=1 Tax=Hondaea fermentalgiana TaxID=2315210 RepID=A0A2R5G5B8_9STRA|nr:N-lysine methyltransferase SMYD2 [Hondaea fermentalgiana]|eukprot:GBG25735.1 N-lysine methyltransferase SMYD2 [Hondaea fermentalgiana]
MLIPSAADMDDLTSLAGVSDASWPSSPGSLQTIGGVTVDTIEEEQRPEDAVKVTRRTAAKGIGLRARRPFTPYEVVFAESPLLEFRRDEDIDRAVYHDLPDEARRAFFRLKDSCSSSNLLERTPSDMSTKSRTEHDDDDASSHRRRRSSCDDKSDRGSTTSSSARRKLVKSASSSSLSSASNNASSSKKRNSQKITKTKENMAINDEINTAIDEPDAVGRLRSDSQRSCISSSACSRRSSRTSALSSSGEGSAASEEDVSPSDMQQQQQQPVAASRRNPKACAGTSDSGDVKPEKTPMGVCETNAICLGGDYFAVLKYGARINHSCAPNLSYRFEEREHSRQVVFYALRHIEKGEELYLSYVDQSLPRDARRALLFERYRFKCKCESCSLKNDELEMAEARRENLAAMDNKIYEAIETEDFDNALEIVDRRLDLLKEEPGLQTPLLMLRTEFDALRICEKMTNIDGMTRWICAATEHARIAHGEASLIYAELCHKTRDIQLLEHIDNFH